MEANYSVDKDRSLVLATLVGECDLAVRKVLIRKVAHDQTTKGLNWLVDIRRCTYVLSPDEVREDHLFIKERFQDLKIAILVHADVQFGMTRLGGSVAEAGGNIFQPFRSYQEAIDWLCSKQPEPEE